MQTTEITTTKLTASAGKWLAPVENNPAEPIFSPEVYLGNSAEAANWHEVTDADKVAAERLAEELHNDRVSQFRNPAPPQTVE